MTSTLYSYMSGDNAEKNWLVVTSHSFHPGHGRQRDGRWEFKSVLQLLVYSQNQQLSLEEKLYLLHLSEFLPELKVCALHRIFNRNIYLLAFASWCWN